MPDLAMSKKEKKTKTTGLLIQISLEILTNSSLTQVPPISKISLKSIHYIFEVSHQQPAKRTNRVKNVTFLADRKNTPILKSMGSLHDSSSILYYVVALSLLLSP